METMTIQEEINADLKTAMLEKDDATKSILRVIIGEFNRLDKIVSDEKAISILKKMLDNAKEIGNISEAAIIEDYLPQQLTENQLQMLISQIIEDEGLSTMKDMGKIMNKLKEEFAGQYDGKLASIIIKKTLA